MTFKDFFAFQLAVKTLWQVFRSGLVPGVEPPFTPIPADRLLLPRPARNSFETAVES
jgi:hypothetical protein